MNAKEETMPLQSISHNATEIIFWTITGSILLTAIIILVVGSSKGKIMSVTDVMNQLNGI